MWSKYSVTQRYQDQLQKTMVCFQKFNKLIAYVSHHLLSNMGDFPPLEVEILLGADNKCVLEMLLFPKWYHMCLQLSCRMRKSRKGGGNAHFLEKYRFLSLKTSKLRIPKTSYGNVLNGKWKLEPYWRHRQSAPFAKVCQLLVMGRCLWKIQWKSCRCQNLGNQLICNVKIRKILIPHHYHNIEHNKLEALQNWRPAS